METRRITYTPQGGVCSKLMVIDAKDGVIENVQIVGQNRWQAAKMMP